MICLFSILEAMEILFMILHAMYIKVESSMYPLEDVDSAYTFSGCVETHDASSSSFLMSKTVVHHRIHI